MSNQTISKKSVIGAAIGTMVEYYESVLFAIFLPITAPLFFPAENTYLSVVKGYTLMMFITLARPLGGLWFGHIGDTTGRRKALIASMYGIAITTIIVGLTPSYQTIGIAATIIIMLAKSIQIFCFGGEYNGAGTYVVEHAKNKSEGLWGSILSATVSVGAFVAALIGVIVTSAHLPDWSWRIAFITAGLFGFWGISFRKDMLEPPKFKAANPKIYSIKNMIQKFPKELIAGGFIGGFATLPITIIIAFINPLLMTKGIITNQQMMLIQLLLITVGVFLIILTGKLADHFSPRKVILLSCLLLAVCSFPLMHIIEKSSLFWIIMAELGFTVINESLLGPSNAFLKNLFPMEYRYRATSFSFCFGLSLIGGLTPITENFLYQLTGHISTAAIWPSFIGICAFFAIRACKKQVKDTIDQTALGEIAT